MKYEIELHGWFPNLVKKWKPKHIEKDEDFLKAIIHGYLIDKDQEEYNELEELGLRQNAIQNYDQNTTQGERLS